MQTKVILSTKNKYKVNDLSPSKAATGVYDYHPSNIEKREKKSSD